jgi:hypothetical protein
VLFTVVVIVVIVLAVMVGVAVLFRSGASQGVESEMVLHTHDELSQRHLADELGDVTNSGVELDGRPGGETFPEPDGPPPVHGAQWDEYAGQWIHWDKASDSWIPVPPPTRPDL